MHRWPPHRPHRYWIDHHPVLVARRLGRHIALAHVIFHLLAPPVGGLAKATAAA